MMYPILSRHYVSTKVNLTIYTLQCQGSGPPGVSTVMMYPVLSLHDVSTKVNLTIYITVLGIWIPWCFYYDDVSCIISALCFDQS